MPNLHIVEHVHVKRTGNGQFRFAFNCPHCQTELTSRPEDVGKPDECPYCNSRFKVSKAVESGEATSEPQRAASSKRPRKAKPERTWQEFESILFKADLNDILTGKAFRDPPTTPPPPNKQKEIPRGSIVCPHCDGMIAENVRLQGQSVTCPHCHAAVTAPGWGPQQEAMQQQVYNAGSGISRGVAIMVWGATMIAFANMEDVDPFGLVPLIIAFVLTFLSAAITEWIVQISFRIRR